MGIMSLSVKHKSAWEFVTFGSGGISVGFFAAEGGTIVLKDPTTGNDVNFYYGGAGAGLSAGLKIPKIGKVQINTRKGPVTGSLGPTEFPSTGTFLVTDSCETDELKLSDIQGLCAFGEVGGGLIAGGSACAMYVGLDPVRLLSLAALPFAAPTAIQFYLNSAKGILLMAGLNVGLQAQIGAASYCGYLR